MNILLKGMKTYSARVFTYCAWTELDAIGGQIGGQVRFKTLASSRFLSRDMLECSQLPVLTWKGCEFVHNMILGQIYSKVSVILTLIRGAIC